MEMWIRSQDREKLVCVKGIEINRPSKESESWIYGVWNNNYERLGFYKTKERALEVLDEIQGRITSNECLKAMISNVNNVKGEEEKIGKLFKDMVYEMPLN